MRSRYFQKIDTEKKQLYIKQEIFNVIYFKKSPLRACAVYMYLFNGYQAKNTAIASELGSLVF